MDKLKRGKEKKHVNKELRGSVSRRDKLVLPKERKWADLTPDILLMIYRKTHIIDVLTKTMKLCRNWFDTARNEPQLWSKVRITAHRNKFGPNYLEDMACVAINWSAGQLEDFAVEEFGSDALLEHVANSTSKLKHLTIISCEGISLGLLQQSIIRWPLLEEIELTRFWCSPKLCETIGQSCPNLKCLRLNRIEHAHDSRFRFPKNSIALSIGGTMHNLRSLELIGNRMTLWGLCAILGGCPKLESLDIRDCPQINDESVHGILGRLKTLRLPSDILYDHKFARHVIRRYCDRKYRYLSDDDSSDSDYYVSDSGDCYHSGYVTHHDYYDSDTDNEDCFDTNCEEVGYATHVQDWKLKGKMSTV